MSTEQARDRRRHRRRDHRPRVGRHQGAEQAAAAAGGCWTFYATIVWAIGYWIVYPAWPTLTGYTKGCSATASAPWSPTRSRPRAGRARPVSRQARSDAARPRSSRDPDLLRFAMAGGAAAFQTNCAPATAAARRASPAIPTSTTTTGCGAAASRRSTRPSASASAPTSKETRASQMPRFGLDKLLDDAQINDVAEYVLSLSGKSTDAGRGRHGARRSSPTNAPPATAPTARASRSRARPT